MEYTCEEMHQEITVLKRTFSTVRLVDPDNCKIVELSHAKDGMVCQSGGTCFRNWYYSYQCANCISARALLTGKAQSKYEMQKDTLFHIVSRPVCVNGKHLALEIVQAINLPDDLFTEIINNVNSHVHTNNHNLLKDVDTPAYNRHYLREHLPNIMISAAQTGHTNAALIRIKNLDRILASSGSIAVSGLMKALYNILIQTFQTETDTPLLVRYDHDAFFLYEKSMDSAQFEAKLCELSKTVRPERILFMDTRLPFSLVTASARIGEECITSGSVLLTTLENRINTSLGTS